MSEARVAMSVRLSAEQKAVIEAHAEACGLDAAVAIRQVLCLCVGYLTREDEVRWPELIHRIDQALKD